MHSLKLIITGFESAIEHAMKLDYLLIYYGCIKTLTKLMKMKLIQVSCGKDFTFVITESNEMLVAGKLPFMIEQLEMDTKI